VKGASIAAKALPALAARDPFYRVGVGGDAQRDVRRAKAAASRSLDKAAARGTARLQFHPRRVDFYPGAVFVELPSEKVSRVGHRDAAHKFGEHSRNAFRLAGGNRQMVDHGALQNFYLDSA
jgi:hypothetical protein